MQFAERPADGFLSGEPIEGGRFAVPEGDDRIEILDDDGLADLRQHLRELMGMGLGFHAAGAANYVWPDISHRRRSSSAGPWPPCYIKSDLPACGA